MTNKTNNEHEEIEGGIPSIGEDRGAINVSPTKAKKGKVLILVGFFIFSIVLLASVIMIVVKQASKSHEQQAASQLKMPTEDLQQATYEPKKTVTNSMQEIIEQQKQAELAKKEQERKDRLAQADADRRKAEQEALERKRAEQEAANRPAPEQPAQPATNDQNKPLTPEQRRLQGATLVDLSANNQVGGLAGQGGAAPNGASQNMDASALLGGSGGASSPINDSLKGESYENGVARNIGDRDYLMIHGTSLPCVVITKIVTDYKGIVKCQLTKDIYSVTGTTMLFERGTQFMGEQKVAITQGVGRVFLNWTEADTPLGIRVRLDSLGTDSLGAAGSEAWIDNHYGERFGGALLISFAQDAFDAAAKSATKNSSDVTFDNSTNTANDMASEVLKNTIGIPPTAYINQGDLVNILVARDIDFKSVYINK